MKRNSMAGRFIAGFATVLAWAASAAAQTVVLGTGDPNIDVPAVQAAVDQGGNVILKGRFSFNKPPTVPTATAFVGGLATVVVWKAVEISGTQDENGEMRRKDSELATIEGGTTPFYVEAPGARVTIRGLRFIRPRGDAIFVYAASGLVIASCKIEGIEPLPTIGEGDGIDIITSSGIPMPTNPGKPENISGTLLIANNDIDLAGGTALDNTVGVLVFSVGVPGAEVEAYVSGNKIINTTEPAINFRRVDGRVYVERNVITTSSISSQKAPGPEAIRVANIGSYLIAHNSIDCRWVDAEAKGIGVFSQIADWPMERAIVVDNDVTMTPPEGTIFGPFSAGINIRGFAQSNVVLNNRIRGRARAALSVEVFKGGIPGSF
jgi:Right handed beta helix region